jgi:hypothetical protein
MCLQKADDCLIERGPTGGGKGIIIRFNFSKTNPS